MGTSLSGLTPATTFDGLLKVGDNDPLTADLKAISDGSGNDSAIQLSTSELKVLGQFNVDTDTAATAINLRGDGLSINQIYQANEVTYNSIVMLNSSGIRLQNGTGTALLARGGNVGIGGITDTPTARLQVKGSGTGATTTSLLVQNSAGTDYLKVTDDGNVQLGSSISVQSTGISAYNSIQLKTFIGGGVYESGLVVTGNGAPSKVGIGETTPTARLHVKGSGATSATTALLVQNSAGTEHLKVTDDGEVNVRDVLFVNHATVSSRALRLDWGSIYGMDNASELSIGAVLAQAATAPRIILGGKTRASGADAIQVQTLNGMYIAPTAFSEDPSAQLHIKGSGASAGTTALLVQNSAGTDLLKVLDDGELAIKSNSGRVFTTSGTSIFSYTSGGGGVLDVNPSNGNSVKFRVRGDNDIYLIQSNPAGDNVGIGASSPDSTDKLQVDSTTQGFLPPRMTFNQKNAITAPAVGLIVYQTDGDEGVYVNTSGGWKQMQLMG